MWLASYLLPFFITDLLFVTPVLPPQLITQHKNQSDLKPGSTAIFNVTAHGVQPFIYMWFKNGALFDNDKVLVVNESSLVIRNVSIEDEGLYSCLVSNIAGNVTSFSAELTIGKLIVRLMSYG